MSKMNEQIRDFNKKLAAFPKVLTEDDIRVLEQTLKQLDPLLIELNKNLPADFDGKTFNQLTDYLADIFKRMEDYKAAITTDQNESNKQTGAAKAYRKVQG